MAAREEQSVVIGLNAAVVAVFDDAPHVLIVRHVSEAAAGGVRPERDGLPFGPFEPLAHRTLEAGLRNLVSRQTGLSMGYVEQLYTFGDRGRHDVQGEGPRVVSVGYLALTRAQGLAPSPDTDWRHWYLYLPWEDWREARPAMIDRLIRPRLKLWAQGATGAAREARMERIHLCFGHDGGAWDEERVLERYELLYEAGLVEEARRDGREIARELRDTPADLGRPMMFDHRRILATAVGRLRGKLKYRPVVFELMPPEFTLLELQRQVEAISGVRLHKQNFRRLVEAGGLVETTGKLSTRSGGRPAALFRFRRDVLRERPAPGVKVSGKVSGKASTARGTRL